MSTRIALLLLALSAPALEAQDSAAVRLAPPSDARAERRAQALTFVGAAGTASAFASWAQAGRMGMTSRQATLFVGATTVAIVGVRQWVAARERRRGH